MNLGKSADMQSLTSEALREKTAELLGESAIKENCMSISRKMQSSDKLTGAAQRIESFIEAKKGREHGNEK